MGDAPLLTFVDGIVLGLRTALHAPNPDWIRHEISRLEEFIGKQGARPVDAEAEWRSWMIELELQSWDRTLTNGKREEANDG